MLYQSVRESAALFQKKLKQKQTYEQVQVFRWKFVILGLGVILIILIGIASELIKQLTARKQVPINTTFLYSLLAKSEFFHGDIGILGELIKGLEISEEIRFDNATLLFSGFHTSGQAISKLISGHQNMLFLLEVADKQNIGSIRKLGMFLHQYLPKIDYKSNSTVTVVDNRDSLISTIFNLQYTKNQRLDKTDSCIIYQYTNSHKQLSLLQLLHFGQSAANAEIRLQINNYDCFGKGSKQQVRKSVSQIVGYELGESAGKELVVRKMEVFWLQMSDVEFENMVFNEGVLMVGRNDNDGDGDI